MNLISKSLTEEALGTAADRLGLQLGKARRVGWQGRSLGAPVRRGEDTCWLRVRGTPFAQARGLKWTGEEDAQILEGIRRPRLLESMDWRIENIAWRANLLEFIDEPPCSPTPDLRSPVEGLDGVVERLRVSLDRLAFQPTERVGVRQDLIDRRLAEFYPGAASNVQHWRTAHGDTHWGNVTTPGAVLLDWEGWGRAPAGMDAAFLLCYAGSNPAAVKTVWSVFGDVLNTPDGRLSRLFAAAELRRMINLHGDHPQLEGHLHEMTSDVWPTQI